MKNNNYKSFIVFLSFILFFSILLPSLTYASITDSAEINSIMSDRNLQLEKAENKTSEVQPLSSSKSCTGTYDSVVGDVTATVQIAKDLNDRTFQWGLAINPREQSLYGSQVTVKLISSKINYSHINPPYTPHTEAPNYNFHGSLKNYQWAGQSGGGTLKSNDEVFLTFQVIGTNKLDKITIDCTVE